MTGPDPSSRYNPWTVRAVRRAFETPWIAVDDADVLNPAGRPARYGLVRFKNLAVGVLPIEPDGRVHLVGQWRLPVGQYSWEMPEGGAPEGEAPEDCARRELAEESGLAADTLIEVLRMHLSNSVTDEFAICYLALGLSRVPAAPEETEVLAHRLVPFRDALAEAVDGRITDAMTVATLLRAHHMATSGVLPPDLARRMLG
jgi:8-oxo-dGTP pyrophosphatase MutT (NUDIX family)